MKHYLLFNKKNNMPNQQISAFSIEDNQGLKLNIEFPTEIVINALVKKKIDMDLFLYPSPYDGETKSVRSTNGYGTEEGFFVNNTIGHPNYLPDGFYTISVKYYRGDQAVEVFIGINGVAVPANYIYDTYPVSGRRPTVTFGANLPLSTYYGGQRRLYKGLTKAGNIYTFNY